MTDHLTRGQLLLYVDGELSCLARAKATEHLRSCWSCRAELNRLEEDIVVILDAHEKVFMPSLSGSPKPWSLVEQKLHAYERPPQASVFLRKVAPITAAVLRPPVAFATTALVAVLIISLIFLPLTPVSAKEVLDHVEIAEARRLAVTPRQAIRQRVHVRKVERSASGTETSTLESWQAGKTSCWNPGRDAVNSDLLSRYKANGVPESLPLSSVAVESWSALAGSNPAISRGDNGELRFQIAPNASARARGLEGVVFRVQPSDWSVNELMLSFSDASFDITEESFSVVDRTEVPRSVLAALDPADPILHTPAIAFTPKPLPAPPAVVPAPNLNDIEMNVRYRLHGIGADLGEGVEVARDDGKVVVKAWPLPEERRAAVARTLGDQPEVRLEFQLADNSAGPKQTVVFPGTRSPQPPDQRLTEFFGSPETEEHYVTGVLESRDELLAHLYALRTLALRWPSDAEAQLSPAAREQLSWMVEDHATGARFALIDLQAALNPLLENFGYTSVPDIPHAAHPQWQDSATSSLDAARRLERTLLSLFTTSNSPATLEEALPSIQRELQELNRSLQALPATDK
jgi:hypothetical protein